MRRSPSRGIDVGRNIGQQPASEEEVRLNDNPSQAAGSQASQTGRQ
jgi:hypothetical protein